MAQTLMTVSNVCLALAFVFLAAAVIAFFRLNIRDVIAEITGKSARKSIEQLREDNKKSGARRFRVLDRSGTDQVSVVTPSDRPAALSTEPLPSETLQQNKNIRKPTEALASEKEDSYQETTGMEEHSEYLETSYMEEDTYEETGMMSEKPASLEGGGVYQETSVLKENPEQSEDYGEKEGRDTIPLAGGELQILQDIVLIHTEEIIP